MRGSTTSYRVRAVVEYFSWLDLPPLTKLAFETWPNINVFFSSSEAKSRKNVPPARRPADFAATNILVRSRLLLQNQAGILFLASARNTFPG